MKNKYLFLIGLFLFLPVKSEIKELNALIVNDEIEKKRTQQTLSSANRKGLSLVWIVVAIAIAAFRYFSS